MKHTRWVAAFWSTCLLLLLTSQARGQYLSPDWLVWTGLPGERFGFSVAGAGDVNGDSIADIIIGADHWLSDEVGRAYIFFGGYPPDTDADVVLIAETAGGSFGWSVAGAGDVNGDGFDDVLVGEIGATGNGRAYLYFGGASMDSIPDVVMLGPPNSFRFGLLVAGAGDVNNDGYADMVISAGMLTGAYLYFGGPNPGTVPDVMLAGARATFAGDLNNDGYDDLIAGFPSGSGTSWACVYFGGAPMDTSADLTLGPGNADGFGGSVAGGSDINGDGWPDLLVGAPLDDAAGTNVGKAYVYFGGPVFDATPDYIISGSQGDQQLGYRVECLGDLDNDGYGDFAVSSDIDLWPFDGKRGKVQFFRGGPSIRYDTTLVGEADQDNFGWSVAGVGDFDRDGKEDVLIGASYAVFADKRGKAYLSSSPIVAVPSATLPVPNGFAVSQNYPNPFNPSTTIRFNLPSRSHVTLTVYDLLGREVATLIDGTLEPGTKSFEFAPHNLSSGVYFYQVKAGTFVQTKEMILLK